MKTETFKLQHVTNELPDKLEVDTFYVITEEGQKEPYHVAYMCPCGCGHEQHLPVKNSETTNEGWDFKIIDGLPDLSPSMQHTAGCKSHYFIKKGKVLWC